MEGAKQCTATLGLRKSRKQALRSFHSQFRTSPLAWSAAHSCYHGRRNAPSKWCREPVASDRALESHPKANQQLDGCASKSWCAYGCRYPDSGVKP